MHCSSILSGQLVGLCARGCGRPSFHRHCPARRGFHQYAGSWLYSATGAYLHTAAGGATRLYAAARAHADYKFDGHPAAAKLLPAACKISRRQLNYQLQIQQQRERERIERIGHSRYRPQPVARVQPTKQPPPTTPNPPVVVNIPKENTTVAPPPSLDKKATEGGKFDVTWISSSMLRILNNF